MYKNILRIALITALLLLIPLAGNSFVEGWNWDLFDFVFAGILIFGTGLAYVLITNKSRSTAYRFTVGFTLAIAFLLIWIQAAVGIIGGGF